MLTAGVVALEHVLIDVQREEQMRVATVLGRFWKHDF
jgi:hypothetical protein